MKNDLLIIPDVHGRDFWRKAVEKEGSDVERIIFLGDYLDPYYFDVIKEDRMVEGLYDILELKKSEPDKVILLEGNHDAHYHFLDEWRNHGRGSRFDPKHAKEYREIFEKNEDLFQMATQWNGRYLFTHAGLTKEWVQKNKFNTDQWKNLDDVVKFLNNLWSKRNPSLGDIGRSRGGRCLSGSPMWADWMEDHMFNTTHKGYPFEGTYQIFGHSLDIFGTNRVLQCAACLDNRAAFVLTEDGEIKEVE